MPPYLLSILLHSDGLTFAYSSPFSSLHFREVPHYEGHLYLGGLNVPSANLAHVGPKEKGIDGKIVECLIEPGVGWKVMRVRTDKTEPNYHTSGVCKCTYCLVSQLFSAHFFHPVSLQPNFDRIFRKL